MIHCTPTDYGFEYGAAKVERLHRFEKTGAVVIGVDTPRQKLQVYVTKTGKVRVFDEHGTEWVAR